MNKSVVEKLKRDRIPEPKKKPKVDKTTKIL
jgi:hypothetical protein